MARDKAPGHGRKEAGRKPPRTLPAMGNMTSLLFLMYFIYAVLGVQLFAKVRLNDNGAFNIHANVSVPHLSNLCPTNCYGPVLGASYILSTRYG